MQELTIELPGAQLAARRAGDGPALVFLHAGVCDQHMWDGVAPAFLDSHTVITYDLRGYGRSSVPDAAFRHIDDLAAVLDSQGLAEATLIGASFGGRVAMEFAAAHAGRVTALALLAPPLPGYDWSADMHTYADAEEQALESGDLDRAVEINMDMWVRGPARTWSQTPDGLADGVREAMRISLAHQGALDEHAEGGPVDPAAIAAPALVVVGDGDVADFQVIAHLLAERMPEAELTVLPGVAHLIAAEQPGTTIELLSRFLKR